MRQSNQAMDIKQRLKFEWPTVELCRDALAEIERLEARVGPAEGDMRVELIVGFLAAMLGPSYDATRRYDFNTVLRDAINAADAVLVRLRPR